MVVTGEAETTKAVVRRGGAGPQAQRLMAGGPLGTCTALGLKRGAEVRGVGRRW
jgi:hypothetical protein